MWPLPVYCPECNYKIKAQATKCCIYTDLSSFSVPASKIVLLSRPFLPQLLSIPTDLWTCPPARIETETHVQKVIDSIAVDPPCQAEGPAAFPLASNEGRGKTSPEGFPLQCTQPGKADPAGRSCTGLCRQSRLPSRAPSRALPLSSALN